MTAGPCSPNLQLIAPELHQLAVDLAVEIAWDGGGEEGYTRGRRDGQRAGEGLGRRIAIQEEIRHRQARTGLYVPAKYLHRQIAATQLFGVPQEVLTAQREARYVLARVVTDKWKSE